MEKVYIIILNYNNYIDTIECIESVLQSSYKNFQVIVIDNNSSDESFEKLIKWAEGDHYIEPKKHKLDHLIYPFCDKPLKYLVYNEKEIYNFNIKEEDFNSKIIFIRANKNKGFSGGNNIGIRYAITRDDFDYIWILNNDTVIPEDTLFKLINYFNKRKDEMLGILGTIQLYYDKPDIIQAVAGKFNKWKGAFLNYGEGVKKDLFKINKFEYVYGASIFLSKELIKKIGLFNEEYFLYYEEIDLCERAKLYGFKIEVADDIFIYHKFSKTISKQGSELRTYYLQKNKILFYKRFYKKYLFFLFLFQLKDLIFEKNKLTILKAMLDGYLGFHIENVKPKLIIIEFNDFHEEVIYPLIEILKYDYEIFLAINQKSYKRGLIEIKENIILIKPFKLLKLFVAFFLMLFIKLKGIKYVIFNTYEDRYVKLINFFLRDKNIKKTGVLHNIDKLKKDEEVKNFLVLSEYIYKNMQKNFPDYKITYFYPLIYNKEIQKIKKKDNVIKICIPGRIEFTRRDYNYLIEALKNKKINKNIKFILLGDGSGEDGRGLINCIKDNKLEKYFEFYNNFIPYNEYFEIILNCDIIMPLIHPCVLNYEKYKATKVSAAFNMAYSFIKPLLLYEDFAKHDEFKEFAIFYSFDNLGDILTAPEFISKIEKVKLKIINNKKFNINMQRQNLINFLRG